MKTDLRTIPGVGENMKGHLEAIGVSCVEDLRGKDPEELYLYRLAVAYAEGRCDAPEKLKWWNWTDEKGGRAL